MEKKNKRIEELDDEGRISDLAFFVDVTGHLNTLNKELQGKDKLVTEMFDSIKAFKVKLRLWKNQLQVHISVHFSHLKSLETIFPERIQEYSRSIFLLQKELDERFQDFKLMEPEFMLFAFPLKADIEKAPENLQMELTNFQCDSNLNQKFFETKLQHFYSYLPKEKFPLLGSFGIRMTAMFGSTYVCEQFFPL
jgi:hypothetical protein